MKTEIEMKMDRIKVFGFDTFFDTIDSLSESYIGKFAIIERCKAYVIIQTNAIGQLIRALSQELKDEASRWEKEFDTWCEPANLVVNSSSNSECDFVIFALHSACF